MEDYTDEQLRQLWHEEMIAEQKQNDRTEIEELEREFEILNWKIN